MIEPAEETRRERKKRQTRQLLVTTAFRLFLQQGYEQTSIAQIAAEADVAKNTFFNHFPTKEDILFADAEQYYQAADDVIAERAPDLSIPDLLREIYQRALARRHDEHPMPGTTAELQDLSRLGANLPAVQAKALHVMFDLQQHIAQALHKAYPDTLDATTAAAAIGSVMGAAQAAAATSLRNGDTPEQYLAATHRAIDLVIQGLHSL